MRKTEKTVGTGLTTHKQTRIEIDASDPEDIALLAKEVSDADPREFSTEGRLEILAENARKTLIQRGHIGALALKSLDPVWANKIIPQGCENNPIFFKDAIIAKCGEDSFENTLAQFVMAWDRLMFERARIQELAGTKRMDLAIGGLIDAAVNCGQIHERALFKNMPVSKKGRSIESLASHALDKKRSKKGSEANTKEANARRKEIAEIVNGFKPDEIPRKKTGELHWGRLATKVLKEAVVQSALAHNKGAHEKANRLNIIAQQSNSTIINAINSAREKGEIPKLN